MSTDPTDPSCTIGNLPNEILANIFHIYTQPSRRLDPDAYLERNRGPRVFGKDPRKCPIRLGNVCARWRAVAHSIPTLWSTIHVLGPRNESDAHLLDIYLQHSSSTTTIVPLDLTIRAPKLDAYNGSVMRLVLTAVSNEAHRWKRLTLVDEGRESAAFLSHQPLDVPHLDAVDVRINSYNYHERELYRTFKKLFSSPVLKAIHVPDDIALPAQSSQLERIYASKAPPLHKFAPVLQQARNSLEEIVMEKDWVEATLHLNSRFGAQDPTRMRRLRSLDLPARALMGLVPLLEAPLLQDLVLRPAPSDRMPQAQNYNMGEIGKVLRAFGQRSQCRLRSLEIRATAPIMMRPNGSIPNVLSLPMCEDLLNLKIFFWKSIAPTAIAALTFRDDADDVLLPNLKTLEFSIPPKDVRVWPDTVQRNLERMLRSRRVYNPTGSVILHTAYSIHG